MQYVRTYICMLKTHYIATVMLITINVLYAIEPDSNTYTKW